MLQTKNNVSTSALITAMVLLVGVLVLAFGYFQKNNLVLNVGLMVTAIGVIGGILQITVRSSA